MPMCRPCHLEGSSLSGCFFDNGSNIGSNVFFFSFSFFFSRGDRIACSDQFTSDNLSTGHDAICFDWPGLEETGEHQLKIKTSGTSILLTYETATAVR